MGAERKPTVAACGWSLCLLAACLRVGSASASAESAPRNADSCPDASAATEEHHRYCIVGAGPAGVQLGHLLKTAGRDYVLLERAARAASFFEAFPVHRTLNSINRRFTRKSDVEHNLRHDWNSLLGREHEPRGLFTNWTEEYWPDAGVLVDYVNEFARPQADQGHLRFCHRVTQVRACDAEEQCRYRLEVTRDCSTGGLGGERLAPGEQDSPECQAARAARFSCEVLVMANGMQRPRIVRDWIQDLNKHAIRYDQLLGIDPSAFRNKSVLLLGEGNAAGETGDAIRNYAKDMVFVSRFHGTNTLQQTRYVGDLRARRTTYLDANSFKSYEGQTNMAAYSDQLVAVACADDDVTGFMGRPAVCLFAVEDRSDAILCPVTPALEGLVDEAKRLFGALVYEREAASHAKSHAKASGHLFRTVRFKAARVLCIKVDDLRGQLTIEQQRILPRLRDTTKYSHYGGMEFQKAFDVVLLSLGWVYDTTVLEGINVRLGGHPKRPLDQKTYPVLTEEYESVSAPGLFVAGAAAHGLDRYRYRASGGFIHGFRFTTRTLFRILETRFEHPDQPDSQPPVRGPHSASHDWDVGRVHAVHDAGALLRHFGTNASTIAERPMWAKLMHRLNNAAGPYEMVGGSLSDVVLFDCQARRTVYMEDLPEDMIHKRYSSFGRVTWSYYYGTIDTNVVEKSNLCSVRSSRVAAIGTFIHPVLQYFPPGSRVPSVTRWLDNPNVDHPSVYWRSTPGVSRIHLPDQFVWGDWADVETLGLLEMFLKEVENAAASHCQGNGTGTVSRRFDEVVDTKFFTAGFAEKLWSLHQKC